MNILLANDDGIDARGIHELADALKGLGDLYISAPDSQRSASGHGITVSQPITVTETTFPGATGAFRMSGTPADCVKLGVKLLQKEGIKIDMVFSGHQPRRKSGDRHPVFRDGISGTGRNHMRDPVRGSFRKQP